MATRILYVEDDGFVAKLAKRRLESDGFEVVICEDGLQGLELAKSGSFDIILLDHMLPNKPGLEILEEIAPNPTAPVIMVSGSSELAVAVEAMRLGAADYVIKETDGSYLDLLPQTVNRVLDHVRLLEAKREADRRIAEQAQIIQGVLDNMDPGVTLFDGDLKLASVNDRFIELFELTHADVTDGISLHDVLERMLDAGEFGSEEAREKMEERFSLFQNGDPFTVDHARPNGVYVEIRGAPMPGSGLIATYTDITDRKRMEDELRRLATTDPLTGADNRRRFMETSMRELARCKRYHHPICALMIDADHFKAVNDTYGHDVGDRVLVALANACRAELRDVDVFGRYGGEEFTITLPETTLETALEVAERLRSVLSNTEVDAEDGRKISFTVSIGAAALSNADDSVEDLLVRADGALYKAKEGGRNRVVAAS